jgi:endonuclease/exonuclease/phosphatase family metal-dependent hydrolase
VKHVTVASYNVHRCVGMDGRRDPERIAQVITELRAQVIGLQEVDSLRPKKTEQVEELAHLTGLQAIAGPTILRKNDYYGNVLLVDGHIKGVRRIDLSVLGREPRGIIDAVVETNAGKLRVIVTHLGLRTVERKHQINRLLETICSKGTQPLVLLGDVNEWWPLSRRLRAIHQCLGKAPGLPTFPSHWPCLCLDRIWVRPLKLLKSVRVDRSPLARVASDHLPVVAEVAVG